MHLGFLFSKVDGRPGAIGRNTANYEDKCFYLGANASRLATDYDILRDKASTLDGFYLASEKTCW